MFFVLSKVASLVILPSSLCIIVCAVGALLMMRWAVLGRRVVYAGIGLLVLFGLSPLSTLLMLPLTERFPPWKDDGRAPDGIVVLGGAIDPSVSEAYGSIELNGSAERMVAMLELARAYPEARLVFSGGSGSLIGDEPPEAKFAGLLLNRFGIEGGRVAFDDVSRTTAENAQITMRLVAPKPGERWLLVTSAFHMPRAVGAFRAAGFPVEAYPVDWQVRGGRDAFQPFSRPSDGLMRSDTAVHEWIGLLSYWLTGRSSALLPAP